MIHISAKHYYQNCYDNRTRSRASDTRLPSAEY